MLVHTRRWAANTAVALAAIAALTPPAVSRGETPIVDPGAVDAVVNPDQLSGFLPKRVAPEVADAIEEFRRRRDAGEWDKAFRALAEAREAHGSQMVADAETPGLFVPLPRLLMRLQVTLPAEGVRAFRVFYDTEAQRRFDAIIAGDAGDEAAALERLVSDFFITSVGDQAADRLGDLQFERGEFLPAERCWAMIVRDYPSSDLPEAKLQAKRAMALARAGREAELAEVVEAIRRRADDRAAVVAGRSVDALDFAVALRTPVAPATQPASGGPTVASVAFPDSDEPAWQMCFLTDEAERKMGQQLQRWGWQGMSLGIGQMLPPAVADDARVYVNWLGVCFALDARTGKLLWRTSQFGAMTDRLQMFVYQEDPDRYAIALVPVGARVLVVGKAVERLGNGEEPFRLACLESETGRIAWTTRTTAEGWNFAGTPLPVGETVYAVAAPRGGSEVSLLALDLASGRERWSVPLGTPQAGQTMMGQGGAALPSPQLIVAGDALYVVTNNGMVLAVSVSRKAVDWAFAYVGATPMPDPMFGGVTRMAHRGAGFYASQRAALLEGDALIIKEPGASSIQAIDTAARKQLWRRTITGGTILIGLDAERIYGVCDGREKSFDVLTRRPPDFRMEHSTRILSSATPVPLVLGRQVLLFGERGIHAIDKTSADPTALHRGFDRGNGGALLLAGDTLVSVSRKHITAYRVTRQEEPPSN